MSVYDDRKHCSFLGYVDCRPIHVPIAATGWCPENNITDTFEVFEFILIYFHLVRFKTREKF